MSSISKQNLYFFGALLVALLVANTANADQDYDDENYGPSGGGSNGNAQGDPDNYNANDDAYGSNQSPSYQQGVDSEGSNSSPGQYASQAGNNGGDSDGDYEGDDSSAAAAIVEPLRSHIRRRRSVTTSNVETSQKTIEPIVAAESAPKTRVKRHGKYYIGPVYTYVKTDKHANFKWGVKHKVGKKHHG